MEQIIKYYPNQNIQYDYFVINNIHDIILNIILDNAIYICDIGYIIVDYIDTESKFYKKYLGMRHDVCREAKQYYADGNIAIISIYNFGKFHGVYQTYYRNHIIDTYIVYNNNIKIEESRYNDNGHIRLYINYIRRIKLKNDFDKQRYVCWFGSDVNYCYYEAYHYSVNDKLIEVYDPYGKIIKYSTLYNLFTPHVHNTIVDLILEYY